MKEKTLRRNSLLRSSTIALLFMGLALIVVIVANTINNTKNDIRSRAFDSSSYEPMSIISEEPGIPGSVLGWLEAVDNRGILGWTCDTTQPGRQIQVGVRYGRQNGSKTVEFFTANAVRTDAIKNLCKSTTANHGFVIPIPSTLNPGDMVEVFGMDETGGVQLKGSPMLSSITRQTPKTGISTFSIEEPGNSTSTLGWLDMIDQRGILGWTCDTTQPGKQISGAVRFGRKDGTKSVEYFKADVGRSEEIKTLCKSTTPNHGFIIPLPKQLKPGDIVEVFGLDKRGYVQLKGSPRQYFPPD